MQPLVATLKKTSIYLYTAPQLPSTDELSTYLWVVTLKNGDDLKCPLFGVECIHYPHCIVNQSNPLIPLKCFSLPWFCRTGFEAWHGYRGKSVEPLQRIHLHPSTVKEALSMPKANIIISIPDWFDSCILSDYIVLLSFSAKVIKVCCPWVFSVNEPITEHSYSQ